MDSTHRTISVSFSCRSRTLYRSVCRDGTPRSHDRTITSQHGTCNIRFLSRARALGMPVCMSLPGQQCCASPPQVHLAARAVGAAWGRWCGSLQGQKSWKHCARPHREAGTVVWGAADSRTLLRCGGVARRQFILMARGLTSARCQGYH
jgi:hypothetical protein